MSGAAEIKSVEMLDRLAAAAAVHVPHRLPLYRAARQGQIALAEYSRSASAKLGRLRRLNLPTVALLGDDDEMASGPDKWVPALPLIGWARCFIVHAAGGAPEHYSVAAAMAALQERLLFIETDSAHLDHWLSILPPQKPTLVIRARAGQPHPRPLDKASFH